LRTDETGKDKNYQQAQPDRRNHTLSLPALCLRFLAENSVRFSTMTLEVPTYLYAPAFEKSQRLLARTAQHAFSQSGYPVHNWAPSPEAAQKDSPRKAVSRIETEWGPALDKSSVRLLACVRILNFV
jgi:hypothetical protein